MCLLLNLLIRNRVNRKRDPMDIRDFRKREPPAADGGTGNRRSRLAVNGFDRAIGQVAGGQGYAVRKNRNNGWSIAREGPTAAG